MSMEPGPHHEGEVVVGRGTTARTPGILWQRANHALKQPTWVEGELVAADTERLVLHIAGEEHVYPSRPDLDSYGVEVPAYAKVSVKQGLLSILLPEGDDAPEVLLVDISTDRK